MKYKAFLVSFFLFAVLSPAVAEDMVEVSADVIEIKSSIENVTGADWIDTLNFAEASNPTSNPSLGNATLGGGFGVAPSIMEVGAIERLSPIAIKIRAMMKDNTAKVIANPKIVTESRSQASFVVGGEIPVPVASATGVSLEWKSYGVNLQIQPEILKTGGQSFVSANVSVAISELDYANSVTLQGFAIPGVSQRTANSKVTIKDGGVIVIAGLKQNRKEIVLKKVPILADIPLLGELFKLKTDRYADTSMVIFITFKIVKQ